MTSAALAEQSAARHATVLIADDHVLVRDGVKLMLIGMFARVSVIEVGDADSLLVAAERMPDIDLAVVDLRMPGMQDGLRLFEIARRHPKIPLVVISALTSPDAIRRSMSVPTVHAFVPKSGASDSVRAAIEAAMQGRKLPYAHGCRSSVESEVPLTPRQAEIRDLLRQGLPNKTIARILGISEGTVKNHITDIFRALKASNRTQAARLGSETE